MSAPYELILSDLTEDQEIFTLTTTRKLLISFDNVNKMSFNIATQVDNDTGTKIASETYYLKIRYNSDGEDEYGDQFEETQSFALPYQTPPATPTANQTALQNLYTAFIAP